MITAIPMNKDHVASHFTKADSFVFLDDNGQILVERINPTLDANCAGKSQLLALLKAENAQRIIVRNIGERMLGVNHCISKRKKHLAAVVVSMVRRMNAIISMIIQSNNAVVTKNTARNIHRHMKNTAVAQCNYLRM